MANSYLYDNIYKIGFNEVQKYIPDFIHPNFITFLSFVFVNLIGFYFTKIHILAILWFLYWVCDNLDGIHARNSNQTSNLGAILDHIVDSYSLLIILKLFFTYNKFNGLTDYLILFSSICFLSSHLLYYYTGELDLGFKNISIDELNLFGFLSLLTCFRITDVINSNLIGLVILGITSYITINNIKKIKEKHNIKIPLFIFIYCILFFMIYHKNLFIMCLINMFISSFLFINNKNNNKILT